MSRLNQRKWERLSVHLDHALDLTSEAREAYLVDVRRTDADLGDELATMLSEHLALSKEGFLEHSPLAAPLPAGAGMRLGAYTLVSSIGQGGMGTVWLAKRTDGRFEGTAAVKLLNAALVGRTGEERFRREGTILARLAHPHIARLFDAGITSTGQPYLILEHVAGQEIDHYCDARHLPVRDRIELFLDVLSAVSHAHAQLVVHRDLKPSNVLVTAEGQVKLLDFGIAKLLEEGEAFASSLTTDGTHLLTPRHAAPEQVNGERITTATDVYALGVLLYELLCGAHPTGAGARTPAEFVRSIIDVEPRPLSEAVERRKKEDGRQKTEDGTQETADRGTELEDDDPAPLSAAALRGTTEERLRRTLRGDLDTILTTALKKNPDERYTSVTELADDLRRFLNDEPVVARPDDAFYRVRKFCRRHRVAVTASAMVLTAIASLTAFYTVQLRAERDRARVQAARAERVSTLLTGVLTLADPYRTPDGGRATMQHMLATATHRIQDELRDQPALQAQMLTAIGRTYERLGDSTTALPLLERALEIARTTLPPGDVQVAQSLNDLGVSYRRQGDPSRARPLLEESLKIRRQALGAHNDVAVTLVELGRALEDAGQAEAAEPLFREALAMRKQVLGDEHRETATSKNELGMLLVRRGNLAEAEPLLRENVATTQRQLGGDHPNTATAKSNLALLLATRGDFAGAERLLHDSIGVARRVFGPTQPDYAQQLGTLALVKEWEGNLAAAQPLLEEALHIVEATLPADHPRVLGMQTNLARLRIGRGDAAATEAPLRAVLATRQRLYPSTDWRVAQVQSLLGAALLAKSAYQEAEPLMLAADRALLPVPGLQARERAANRRRLAQLYSATGRSAEAHHYRSNRDGGFFH